MTETVNYGILYVITEILLKGDFHRASFAHLPVVGAYEDWKECPPSSN